MFLQRGNQTLIASLRFGSCLANFARQLIHPALESGCLGAAVGAAGKQAEGDQAKSGFRHAGAARLAK
jgi:hypothetical protein